MSIYKVEYLSVINCKEGFCRTIESFNSLIQSYGDIKVVDDKIEYEGVIFDYKVHMGDIDGGDKKFFHLEFFCSGKDKLESFKLFLRSVRTLLSRVGEKPPEVLWDDLSGELSAAAYPVIHDLENLMRKLITKFMLITIGGAWTSSVVPQDVSDSIKNKKAISHNYLYDTDFNQLANFLFKKYATGNLNSLVAKIAAAKVITDIDLLELKELVPLSNWERYFSPVIECSSEYLEVRWGKLYELRCMIAHNNFINSENFEAITVLASEVKIKLVDAILNIDRIHVSAIQKEEVVESVASSMASQDSSLASAWNGLVEDLQFLAGLVKNEKSIFKSSRALNFRMCADKILRDGHIGIELYEKLQGLNLRRNQFILLYLEEDKSSEFDYLVKSINQVRFELRTVLTELL